MPDQESQSLVGRMRERNPQRFEVLVASTPLVYQLECGAHSCLSRDEGAIEWPQGPAVIVAV